MLPYPLKLWLDMDGFINGILEVTNCAIKIDHYGVISAYPLNFHHQFLITTKEAKQ